MLIKWDLMVFHGDFMMIFDDFMGFNADLM